MNAKNEPRLKGTDTTKLIEYLEKDFIVEYELDENNKLSKIIWMKLEIIEKYHESLRYICSDTTFNTNMYRLPLATISTLTP